MPLCMKRSILIYLLCLIVTPTAEALGPPTRSDTERRRFKTMGPQEKPCSSKT